MVDQAVVQFKKYRDAHAVHHDEQTATDHGDWRDAFVERVLDRNQGGPIGLIA